MKSKSTLVLMMVAMFGSSLSFNAAASNGHSMLAKCSVAMRVLEDASIQLTTEQYLDASLCMGFINGAVNMNTLYSDMTQGNALFCVDKSLSLTEATNEFVTYLEKNPDKLGNDSGSLLAIAIGKNHPCKAQ